MVSLRNEIHKRRKLPNNCAQVTRASSHQQQQHPRVSRVSSDDALIRASLETPDAKSRSHIDLEFNVQINPESVHLKDRVPCEVDNHHHHSPPEETSRTEERDFVDIKRSVEQEESLLHDIQSTQEIEVTRGSEDMESHEEPKGSEEMKGLEETNGNEEIEGSEETKGSEEMKGLGEMDGLEEMEIKEETNEVGGRNDVEQSSSVEERVGGEEIRDIEEPKEEDDVDVDDDDDNLPIGKILIKGKKNPLRADENRQNSSMGSRGSLKGKSGERSMVVGEDKFKEGDMVWAKVKSHPWWPGHVYNPALASATARRGRKAGHMLIAFFGDSSYGWFMESDLVPFDDFFQEKSMQSTTRNFLKAVEEAVDEVGRRALLGLNCPCQDTVSLKHAKFKGYVNLVIDGYVVPGLYPEKLIDAAREQFDPRNMVEFVRRMGVLPGSGEDRTISGIKCVSEVLAYRTTVYTSFRDSGYKDFLQKLEGVSEDDSKDGGLEEETLGLNAFASPAGCSDSTRQSSPDIADKECRTITNQFPNHTSSSGGIVSEGTKAIIKEKEAEAVVPKSSHKVKLKSKSIAELVNAKKGYKGRNSNSKDQASKPCSVEKVGDRKDKRSSKKRDFLGSTAIPDPLSKQGKTGSPDVLQRVKQVTKEGGSMTSITSNSETIKDNRPVKVHSQMIGKYPRKVEISKKSVQASSDLDKMDKSKNSSSSSHQANDNPNTTQELEDSTLLKGLIQLSTKSSIVLKADEAKIPLSSQFKPSIDQKGNECQATSETIAMEQESATLLDPVGESKQSAPEDITLDEREDEGNKVVHSVPTKRIGRLIPNNSSLEISESDNKTNPETMQSELETAEGTADGCCDSIMAVDVTVASLNPSKSQKNFDREVLKKESLKKLKKFAKQPSFKSLSKKASVRKQDNEDEAGISKHMERPFKRSKLEGNVGRVESHREEQKCMVMPGTHKSRKTMLKVESDNSRNGRAALHREERAHVDVPETHNSRKVALRGENSNVLSDQAERGSISYKEINAQFSSSEIRQYLTDLKLLAMNPDHGMEWNCSSKVSDFFLKFRSHAFKKSLQVLPSSEISRISHPQHVSDEEQENGRSMAAEATVPNVSEVSENANSKISSIDILEAPAVPELMKQPQVSQEQKSSIDLYLEAKEPKKRKPDTDYSPLGPLKRLRKLKDLQVKSSPKNGSKPILKKIPGILSDHKERSGHIKEKTEEFKKEKKHAPERSSVLSNLEDEQPMALVMKFPKDFALPSEVQLRVKFARFGSLDISGTRIYCNTRSAQVVFKRSADAEAAYKNATIGALFGKSNVTFRLKNLSQPKKESIVAKTQSVPREKNSLTTAKEEFPSLKLSDQVRKSKTTPEYSTKPFPLPCSDQPKSILKRPDELTNGNIIRENPHVTFQLENVEDLSTRQQSLDENFQGEDVHTSSSILENDTVFTQGVENKFISFQVPDISNQMMFLLQKCNDIVSNLSVSLGCVPYYPL